MQLRNALKHQPWALGRGERSLGCGTCEPQGSTSSPLVLGTCSCLCSQYISHLLFPLLLSTYSEYKGVFFRGVNYLILISDSKVRKCNIQLLKPLDL